MLGHVLNKSTNVFCQYCLASCLGKKVSGVEQCWRTSAKLPYHRPPPQLNEGVMLGELRILLFLFFEQMFLFMMPILCADSGPRRKISRAWTPISAIMTSSGSTCPSHQESAWGAAEAWQEKDNAEVVRKGIVVGKCWSMCWTHLQMFSASTVLGKKASEVEQS